MNEENVKKISYREAKEYLISFNKENNISSKGVSKDKHASIVVVVTEESFEEVYPLEGRSYLVSHDNKAFMDNMGGYSIYAGSLDRTDPCVRLEGYLEDEGNPGGWKVEYCYIKE